METLNKKRYQEKLRTADEVARMIRSGDEIFFAEFALRPESLDEALASGRVTRDDAPDTASQLRKLLYGRTGAAVVNELVARWVLRGLHEPGADSLRFSERSVGLAWMRFGFTRARDWRALVGRLDAEIERMRADGRLQAIVDTYR